MKYKNVLLGILSGLLLVQSISFLYRRSQEKANWTLGTQLELMANQHKSTDASSQAQLTIAELKLLDPKTSESAISMLKELINQNIKEDIRIRAQLILARHIRKDNPEYANELFQKVADQSVNINEQLLAKFFIADQMMVKDPTAPLMEAVTLLESILEKAKEINKDLAARIMDDLGMLLYKTDPKRAKFLLEEVSKQDFNQFAKDHAEKALKELKKF